MVRAAKPFKTLDQQIALLSGRGMAVSTDEALPWLAHVGYYRLSGYFYPYRMIATMPHTGGRLDDFESGTDFSYVTALYEFDRKLRALIFDALERVEIALRSQLSYQLGAKDPFDYRNASSFRPGFDHHSWLTTVTKRVNRSRRHSDPIRHYDQHYNGDLPIWVLVDVLDFSEVSRAFEGLPAQAQWTIGDNIGLSINLQPLTKNQRRKTAANHPLARWLEQLTIVRNTCAHHSRTWNRSFTPVGTAALKTVDMLGSLPDSQSERLYGALLVMGRLLQAVSPGSTWMSKVRSLIITQLEAIPGRSAAEVGFPPEWKQDPAWHE